MVNLISGIHISTLNYLYGPFLEYYKKRVVYMLTLELKITHTQKYA